MFLYNISPDSWKGFIDKKKYGDIMRKVSEGTLHDVRMIAAARLVWIAWEEDCW